MILGVQKNNRSGSQRFYAVLDELAKLHEKKSRDYGTDDDPLMNFRGAKDWGFPAWIGPCLRIEDKLQRLKTHASRGNLVNEGARDAFMDLAVYAVLALVLWEEAT